MSFSCNVSHADTFHPHLMMCTNMTTILSHQEDLGPSMLDVKYEGLGGTGLVTTPLNMAPNLSECNVSHGGIALHQSWSMGAGVLSGNGRTSPPAYFSVQLSLPQPPTIMHTHTLRLLRHHITNCHKVLSNNIVLKMICALLFVYVSVDAQWLGGRMLDS